MNGVEFNLNEEKKKQTTHIAHEMKVKIICETNIDTRLHSCSDTHTHTYE